MAPISLARGVPAPELLPAEELADCMSAVLRREGGALLNYGPVAGYAPLREWVAARHGVAASRVLLTPGSLPGLFMVAQLLLERGRRPLVEAPSYDRPLRFLERLGAPITAVPLLDTGLDLDALAARSADGASTFLYVIPTFQNPSGRTYDLRAREALVELARERELVVLEDDPYREVRFGEPPPPTLFELAEGDGVVYASSFSKVVAPGLRVGYLIAPDELVPDLERRAVGTYLSPALAPQAALHEFIERGLLEPTLDTMRSALRERRDALLHALQRHLDTVARWSHPDGGYFVWLDLPEAVSADDAFERAATAGVAVVKGTDFYPHGAGGQRSLRLAYSFVSPLELADGAARLAAALPAPAAV